MILSVLNPNCQWLPWPHDLLAWMATVPGRIMEVDSIGPLDDPDILSKFAGAIHFHVKSRKIHMEPPSHGAPSARGMLKLLKNLWISDVFRSAHLPKV